MMPPRSIFNGTIAFGQVNVPVKVHSATEDQSVHFSEVHATDQAKIEHRRICPKHGEVPHDEVVKGYEVKPDKYVVLTNEEIAAAAGRRSKVIELDEFVCAEDIDPVFFDRTYYLGAAEKGDGEDAYRLLHDALAKAKRAAIGRWVFHNREYMVAVRPADGVLRLHTMRFADELVADKDLELATPNKKPGKREVDMAATLVDSLHSDFDVTRFKDDYRDAVMKVIRDKAKGKEIEPPPPAPSPDPDSLLAQLEAAVESSNGGGKKKRKAKA
jgi:DNA end-binding protein Ku